MEDMTEGLRDIGVNGFVRFTIRAQDNESNRATHEAFKRFCELECDNNYTFGIRRLLEEYESDAKIEMLWEQISALQQRVNEIEDKIAAPKKKEGPAELF